MIYDELHNKLSAVETQAPPIWRNSDKRQWGHLFSTAVGEVWKLLLRYLVFRGNKSRYLRYLGVRVGKDCDILTDIKNFGTEPWLIEIGSRVTLTQGVILITHDGSNRLFRETLSGSSIWGNRFGTIRIGDNCFIGVNTIILPDVEIGHDSIVGAGSVVNKNVPPGSVVAGVPAREICSLDEYIARYQQKMIPIQAFSRRQLRRELTQRFWGELR